MTRLHIGIIKYQVRMKTESVLIIRLNQETTQLFLDFQVWIHFPKLKIKGFMDQ